MVMASRACQMGFVSSLTSWIIQLISRSMYEAVAATRLGEALIAQMFASHLKAVTIYMEGWALEDATAIQTDSIVSIMLPFRR